MNVALCMIVRDGIGDGIEQAIASARPWVDEVCVWENGSSDGTPELLERLASEPGAPIVVERGTWTNDYGAARAASFAMTRAEWVVYIDADDRLIGGDALPELIAAAGNADQIYVAYDSCDFYKGNLWMWWPRVVRHGSGRWQGAIHERWIGDRAGPPWQDAHPARIHVRHTKRASDPNRYRQAIAAAAEDPARTPWALGYHAEQLMADRNWPAALETWTCYLEEHLDRDDEGEPNWDRIKALHGLQRTYMSLGRYPEAEACALQWLSYVRAAKSTLGPRGKLVQAVNGSAITATLAAMASAAAPLLVDWSNVVAVLA